MLPVKIKFLKKTVAPLYATSGAAAADLYAALDAPVTVGAGERYSVPTGIAMEIPDGYVGIISGRSGFAKKYGVSLANGIGVIDSDYRGEVQILLINRGDNPLVIENGDRVAQMMFLRVERAAFIECESLDGTARGDGGFGSSGIK